MTSASRPSIEWAALLRTVDFEQHACVERLRQLRGDAFAISSALPNWTRAHVVAHLAGNARAHARQLTHAAQNRVVAMYDGGNDARAAAIEISARQDSAALVADLQSAHDDVLRGARQFTASTSLRPVSYRQGTVHDLLQARLMELHLHQIDLNLPGYDAHSIPITAAKSIIQLLAARVPDSQQWNLIAPEFWVAIGAGEPIKLRSTASSLACFLAERPCQEIPFEGRPKPLQPWPDRESSLAHLRFNEL